MRSITIEHPVFEQALWEEVRTIRTEVFVVEQLVDEEEEYDLYEATARHFLAFLEGEPAGTARWRQTEKGFKLERFAVLQRFRGKGIGKALVNAVLSEVIPQAKAAGKPIYLHAQVQALPFYAGLGFAPYGELFEEANIVHQAMAFTLP
jgi:predicted GNAT family N-acyltransferase